MIQEMRGAAQMAGALCGLLDRGDNFSPGTEIDALDERKQMMKLQFRKFQFQRPQ